MGRKKKIIFEAEASDAGSNTTVCSVGVPFFLCPKRIRDKFFDCADGHSYFTREEFGDGSCFFHSIATLLNLHHDSADSDPARLQKEVLTNIRQK